MAKSIFDYKGWSVTGWEIRQYLFTLKLGLFDSKLLAGEFALQNGCSFCEVSFNKPTRIFFKNFRPHNSSFIKDILLIPEIKPKDGYRFLVDEESYFEIMSPNYSIINW